MKISFAITVCNEIEEIKRLHKQFDDQWSECHDGNDDACCKLHE